MLYSFSFSFLGHHIEAIYHVEHYVARLRVDPCFGATLGIHSVLHVADLLQDVYGIEAEGKITLKMVLATEVFHTQLVVLSVLSL